MNLKSWGFNTLGMHNPPLASLRSAEVAAYVVELDLHAPWGWNMKRSELTRAFARNPMDVFDGAFAAAARANAEQCVRPVAADPRVLGYAYTDGPPWTVDEDGPGAGPVLHPWVGAIMSLPADAPGKQAWLALMKARYASAGDAGATYGRAATTWDELAAVTVWPAVSNAPVAAADSRAFLERLMRQWYEVRRDAIRAIDARHLILGDKLNANRDARHPDDRAWSLAVVKDYVDVIFIQYYAPIGEQRGTLAAIHDSTGKPILIGDTACRPLWKDCAPDDVAFYGDMGSVYADHVTGLFELPYVVGWHHCGYMRGLRPPYVAALKRGDRAAIEDHVKRKMTLREGFITETEQPLDRLLTPLVGALADAERVHRASGAAGASR